MAKKYFSMNTVPIGTKMIVNESQEEVTLIEVQNFPTTFIVQDSFGNKEKYYTHQVEILDSSKE